MPYLINVGPRPENESGFGSRGYHIYRRANTVIWKWGQVEVIPGRKGRTFWKYFKQKNIFHRSKKKAVDALEKKLVALVDKGYDQLPVGVMIFPIRRK
jgi:hypothetical protein